MRSPRWRFACSANASIAAGSAASHDLTPEVGHAEDSIAIEHDGDVLARGRRRIVHENVGEKDVENTARAKDIRSAGASVEREIGWIIDR